MSSPLLAPPHILHINGHPGGEPQAFLAQATRELLREGIEQTVLHPAPGPDNPSLQHALPIGVRALALRGTGPSPLAFARHLPAALQAELETHRYAAVHFHGPLVGLIGSIAMASAVPRSRPPLFYSPHAHVSSATLLQRIACVRACKPVASGSAEARDMRRLMRQDTFALETAVDSEFFKVTPVPDEVPLVVGMGHGRDGSGASWFGDLAARFHFAGEAARFLWIGGCEPAVHERLLAAGVALPGWLPDGQVREVLARARVYVQASRWRKTPRSMLQAMACAVPCVATDVASHREALRSEETGLLAGDLSDMAFQIKHLLDHPARSRQMGMAARRDALARFALPRLRQSLLALYGLDDSRRSPALPAQTWLAV
jgi:hypothetical protein